MLDPIDFIYKKILKKSFEDIKLEISDLLELALQRRVQATFHSVMLSGGIDSSLITLLHKRFRS